MYSKIMPTSVPDPDEAAEDGLEDELQPFEPVLPGDDSEPEFSVPLLHNYMEDMLREKLPHTMKVLRCCSCERCTLDILALTLNSLPSSYAVTVRDETLDRVKVLRREYEVKVTATLIKAIQQVKSAPRHGSGGMPPL